MKKIHVISKTHLDLGFTDYAANIEKLYRDKFIPQALDIAEEVNIDGKKFIWTTGSYLIYDALINSSEINKNRLKRALLNGDITPHGLLFTTHTELLDDDAFCYGLEIAQALSKEYNINIQAAKMTDVPGHTMAIIPLLAQYGIKLLHIGVNEGSAMPDVPKAFVWRNKDSEIVVIYEGSYGELYKNEHIDDILYFAHSSDNHGPINKNNYLKIINKLEKDYPDYQVAASTLDEYARVIWSVKDKLPVVTSEIGDSWIHGAASDPYKSAAIRELIAAKKQWLEKGIITKGDNDYCVINECILKMAEHTWGMDVKRHLSDIGIFLKKDFASAREKDSANKCLFSCEGIWWKFKTAILRLIGVYNKGSYRAMEKSWSEQREYIDKLLEHIDNGRREELSKRLNILLPNQEFNAKGMIRLAVNKIISIGDNSISINEYGAINKLVLNGNCIINNNTKAIISYNSYSSDDYDYWLQNYSRNLDKNKIWVVPDFARPALAHYKGKYSIGNYPYQVKDINYLINYNELIVIASLGIDERLSDELGAPRVFNIRYTLNLKGKLDIELLWLNKDASRLSESLFMHLNIIIDKDSLRYYKLGQEINPYDVVVNGNRNLSAVESIRLECNKKRYKVINHHSPLVAMGCGKILKFDNQYESIDNGISYNLYNNVWGTNFPLWYSDNAYFKYSIIED